MNALRAKKLGHDICRQQARLEIAAHYGFRAGFSLERASREESQGSSQRMLANLQSIPNVSGNLFQPGRPIDTRSHLPVRVSEKIRILEDLQAKEIIELSSAFKARGAAEGWPISDKLLDRIKDLQHALLAGGKRRVAKQKTYARASQGQSHREQTLELRDGRMPPRARCQQNVRARCGGGARLIPARAFSLEQPDYGTLEKRFRRGDRRLSRRENLPEQG